MKWYEEKDGVVSAMRIMAMIAIIVGSLVTIAGAVAIYISQADGIALAGTGAGIISVALGAKAWQSKSEGE